MRVQVRLGSSRLAPAGLSGLDDATLAGRASQRDTAAFEELYRRHARSAWNVALAVSGNRDDAADAVADAFVRIFQALPEGRLLDGDHFRHYLFAATRNAAIDGRRRVGRLQPTAHEQLDGPATTTGPQDRVTRDADSALVATAFRGLPERWRSVLWLTEVEGIPPREVANRLGVTANNAAQMAARARARLRDRYLQAHLGASVADGCRSSVERMGTYVAGHLAPRDVAKVDQHLTGCEPCRRRASELADLSTSLRRTALPLPLLLAPAVMAKFKAAVLGSTVGIGSAAGAGGGAGVASSAGGAGASAGGGGLGVL
ncbi:MAG: sigma-70 family RNA polymerase sigma factor, partial [Acidimicrobiales bacterium]